MLTTEDKTEDTDSRARPVRTLRFTKEVLDIRAGILLVASDLFNPKLTFDDDAVLNL
jgi:hypothetical protein